MKTLTEWFARHSLAANLLVLVTIIGAFIATERLPREILPKTEARNILVTSTWPGANASSIEEQLCTPIEKNLLVLTGIDHIRSTAIDNQCMINIELEASTNSNQAINDITAAVHRVSLPSQALQPVIKDSFREPMVIRLAISGSANYAELVNTGNRVVRELKSLGINNVRIIEAKKPEIIITVSLQKLQQYQMSMAEIANALQQNNNVIPSGHIDVEGMATAVISGNGYQTMEELSDSIIRALPDGSTLRLKDIASFQSQYTGPEGHINGEPSLAIAIYQGSNGNISHISSITNRYVAQQQKTLPDNIRLHVVFDNARFFTARMDYLSSNFFSGLMASSLILLLWLRFRLAFWMTADIPIAFGGGLIWLYLMGGSLNVVSAFGLIVVLGIVCDDAIVIGENVHRHQNSGKPGLEGAIAGVTEMANTVVFAVGTTVLMFMPLLFLPGREGELMRPLPMIVIAILIASLIEALLVLPTHLAHYKPTGSTENMGYRLANMLDDFIIRHYRPTLEWLIRWRYAVVAGCFSLFIVSISFVLSGKAQVNLFSAVDTEIATGAVSFTEGSDPKLALQATRKMENAAMQLQQILKRETGKDQITLVRSFVMKNASHGEVYLSLGSGDKNRMKSADIMQRWRNMTGNIPEATELSFNASVNINHDNLNIWLQGDDEDTLAKASSALREELQHYQGINHITDTFSQTHKEIHLQPRQEAHDLGLSLQVLSAQMHIALEGIDLPDIGNHSVSLQLDEDKTRPLEWLQNLPIQIAPNHILPLSAVARLHVDNKPFAILHNDGKRSSLVSATIDESQISRTELIRHLQQDFLPHLMKTYPGIGWTRGGALESETRIRHYLTFSFALSLTIMFLLLAISLKSVYQPFMIFTAIPFGIVGALLGHLLTGLQLTLWSVAGMIAVSGIVVNNNMVIIFFINERLKAGEDFLRTVINAGVHRFRPVMLTTITTFIGVFPTILNQSWEAQFLIPMAISIGFGVLFAAFMTLFLVPCIYIVGNDISQTIKHR